MKRKKPKMVRVRFDSTRGIELRKRLDATIQESLDYIKASGAHSAEGFYRTPTGPSGVDVT